MLQDRAASWPLRLLRCLAATAAVLLQRDRGGQGKGKGCVERRIWMNDALAVSVVQWSHSSTA